MGSRGDGDDQLSASAPDLSIDHFLPWLDGEWEVGGHDLRLPMTLTAAEPLEGSPRPAGGFRLEFRGPADPILPQAILNVAGPGGAYEIFLVPIGHDVHGTRYEAVFY